MNIFEFTEIQDPTSFNEMERRDSTLICVVPEALGKPTRLVCKNGRIICETESGVTFLVPQESNVF